MDDLDITPADLHDRDHTAAIVALLEDFVADPAVGSRRLAPDVRAGVVDGLRKHPTTRVWLAWQAGDPVGLAVCFVGFSTFAARPVLNVHDLSVRRELRGQGVGRRLLEAIETEAVALGCCKLTLEVREDNERARAVYDRFGFGRDDYDGPTYATLFLEKPLSPT